MTNARTRRFVTGPRALGVAVVAGGLVLGGSAIAYADGSPAPTSSGPAASGQGPAASGQGSAASGQGSAAASGAPAPGTSGAPAAPSGAPQPPSGSASGSAQAPSGKAPSGKAPSGKALSGKAPSGKAPAGAPQGPAGRGPAGGPMAGGPGAAPAVTGTLTAVDGSTLTVRSDAGRTYTVTLKSGATIHEGPKTLSASKLSNGERVTVVGSVSGSSVSATGVDVREAHVDGTVIAVNGDTVTVVDGDGFHRTVDTSGVSDAKVSVGEQVHAEGTVASNGTTLAATSIGTPPTPKAAHGN